MAVGFASLSSVLIDYSETHTFERKTERKKQMDDGQTDRQMDGLLGINSSGDISSGHTVDVDIFCE